MMSDAVSYEELKNRLTNTDCDECGTLLPPVHPEADQLQVDGGLVIDVTGGYGMFFDGAFDERAPYLIVLCHDCVVKMFNAVPNATRVLPKGHSAGNIASRNPHEECCPWGSVWKGAK